MSQSNEIQKKLVIEQQKEQNSVNTFIQKLYECPIFTFSFLWEYAEHVHYYKLVNFFSYGYRYFIDSSSAKISSILPGGKSQVFVSSCPIDQQGYGISVSMFYHQLAGAAGCYPQQGTTEGSLLLKQLTTHPSQCRFNSWRPGNISCLPFAV